MACKNWDIVVGVAVMVVPLALVLVSMTALARITVVMMMFARIMAIVMIMAIAVTWRCWSCVTKRTFHLDPLIMRSHVGLFV